MINYYIFTGFLIAVSKMLVIRHLVFLVAIITSPERRTQKTIDKLKNVAGRFFKK